MHNLCTCDSELHNMFAVFLKLFLKIEIAIKKEKFEILFLKRSNKDINKYLVLIYNITIIITLFL